MRKLFPIVLLLLPLSGCSLYGSALSDSVTTHYALSHAIGSEANPLLPNNAAGAALGSFAVKLGVSYAAREYASPENCTSIVRSVTAAGTGAAINNLLVIAGVAEGGVPLIAGLAMGLWNYQAGQKSAQSFCVKENAESTDQPKKDSLVI